MTLTIYEGTSTANNASAYMVTGGEWTSGTISWENMPAAETLLQENISHNNLTKYQFSCLTAVRHWYDGDITGQNENYGVMIRYYDETIADYNSVFSADYTVATQRPTMTISYTPASSSVEVDKGGTKTLSVTGATGTVTWTSADPSVATVDANGVVTGVELGTATITASIGDMEYQTFTVSVILADGVYYISNQSSGLRLGTNGATEENTPVVQFSTASAGFEQICRLWKITYLGDEYYSIRPMHKLNMGLHADGTVGSSVSIVDIGTSDTLSAVSPLNRWGISPKPGGGGYFIDHVATSSLRLRSLEGASSPGLGVTISSNDDSSYLYWSLIKVTDPPVGPIFYEPSTQKFIDYTCSRYITVGATKTLTELDLAIYAFSEQETDEISWNCKSGSMHIYLNQSDGTITARSPGTALITASNDYGSIDLYITVVSNSISDFTLSNHYDSSFIEDSELVTYIDDAVYFVRTVYQRQFGISISADSEPYYRTKAITDECPLETFESCHGETLCKGTCNSSHHKNVYRVSDHFYSSTIPQNHVVVFWTDRDFTTYCMDGRYVFSAFGYSAVYALVWKHRPVIHMLTVDDNDNNRLPCMATNLAHEFVHTLGMKDKTDSAHSGTSWNCIMDLYNGDEDLLAEYYRQLLYGEKELFCTSCEAEVRTLLEQYE